MRYSLINGLLLLAISPFTALALPVDPNDQGGQWDPSGQYRKGHYDSNGDFIASGGSSQIGLNENGQYYQNGQNTRNGAGWTDAKGVWHSTDYSQGWTDVNGVWHNNPNNGQNNNNKGGWTDANGQWHANQKRNIVPGDYNPGHPIPANDAAAVSSITHVPRHYPNNDRYDIYREQEETNRLQEHKEDGATAEDVASAMLPGSVVPRNYPQDQNNWKNNDNDKISNGWSQNVPQANPVGNYNNDVHDEDHHHDKDHHEDKDINATADKLE